MPDQISTPSASPLFNPNHLDFSTVASNALHYWERKRLVYNGALALISIVIIVGGLPRSLAALTFNMAQQFFLLAVIANVLYCSAYVVDVFVQLSRYRETWLRMRWLLLLIGTSAAGIIARNITIGSLGLR